MEARVSRQPCAGSQSRAHQFERTSCWSPGKTLWSASLKDIESQAVLLPDLEGDSVPDLLVATLPADKVTFANAL